MVFDHWTAAAEAAAINSLIVYSHSLPPLLFVPDFGHAAKRLPSQLIPSLFPTRGYSNIFSAATDEDGRTDGGLERMPSNARLKGFPRDIVHTSHTRARRSILPTPCLRLDPRLDARVDDEVAGGGDLVANFGSKRRALPRR